MAEKWIRCVDCDTVARITDYDTLPSYYYDQDKEEVIEKPMDDEARFMDLHKCHTLEELFIVKDSFISNGRYGEPLRVNYFEATNGTERFVIKGWRKDIDHPMSYEVMPGYIETSFALEVQSREIRKQLSEEIKDPPLSDTAIERFIQIVEKVVSRLPVGDPLEITAETDTPLVSHCKMGTGSIREILSLAREVFDESELRKIKRFIHHNNNYNEPMTLLLKRRFTVKRDNVEEKSGTCCERNAAQGN